MEMEEAKSKPATEIDALWKGVHPEIKPEGWQPRTKVFVHLSTEITLFFYIIIHKTKTIYEYALKDLSFATKLISVAQAV